MLDLTKNQVIWSWLIPAHGSWSWTCIFQFPCIVAWNWPWLRVTPWKSANTTAGQETHSRKPIQLYPHITARNPVAVGLAVIPLLALLMHLAKHWILGYTKTQSAVQAKSITGIWLMDRMGRGAHRVHVCECDYDEQKGWSHWVDGEGARTQTCMEAWHWEPGWGSWGGNGHTSVGLFQVRQKLYSRLPWRPATRGNLCRLSCALCLASSDQRHTLRVESVPLQGLTNVLCCHLVMTNGDSGSKIPYSEH